MTHVLLTRIFPYICVIITCTKPEIIKYTLLEGGLKYFSDQP